MCGTENGEKKKTVSKFSECLLANISEEDLIANIEALQKIYPKDISIAFIIQIFISTAIKG